MKNKQKGFVNVILFAMLLSLVTLLIVLVIGVTKKKQDLLHLNLDDWKCLEYSERSYQYPVVVGKLTTMQTGTRTECNQWVRK